MTTFDAIVLPLEIEQALADHELGWRVAGVCEELRILIAGLARTSAEIRRLIRTLDEIQR